MGDKSPIVSAAANPALDLQNKNLPLSSSTLAHTQPGSRSLQDNFTNFKSQLAMQAKPGSGLFLNLPQRSNALI